MIEVIPVMLFILGWHPDRPGEIDFRRVETVFLSMEQCEQAGSSLAEDLTTAVAEEGGMRFQHRCVEIPAREEFDEAFEQLEAPSQ